MARARTTIEIDHEAVRRVMQRYGLRTQTEAVNLALQSLASQPMTWDEAHEMEGAHAIEVIPEERPPSA